MSNVKQKRHPRRPDQEWLDLIQECRSSGMTDKAWCEMNHIQPSKFYYHIRRLRKKACDIPANSKSASLEHHEIVKLQFDSIYVNKICYCREAFFNKFFQKK